MINTQLPLVDLHRHLDGNIKPALIWELAQKYDIQLSASSLEELIPLAQIQDKTSDLLAFLKRLDYGISVLADVDACRQVAYANMQDAFNENLDYVELRFSPYYMAQPHNLNVAEVVAAVVDGVRQGETDFGVKANLIGILSRTFGVQACQQELEGLLAHKTDITALDLAGDEINYPAELFKGLFDKGRDAGWQVTVHAGEAAGPESIWNAIKLLGATRIGHCVAAIQDPTLMDYLADNNIGIESCPTSNYQTATVQDIPSHPMRQFFERGLPVTLNTDDPGVSAIDIQYEYDVAHRVIGFNEQQLAQIQRNGVEQAFLSDTEKKAMFERALTR
ncbi:adenosine deaminase [Aestuariibacter salexigens]|uniref:adenosine deaminase n=1 Tax=Aestuariibacter salexigens TaxID=226010 RepID=UPI00040E025A|nr:adenosine deaminase [Aestuariibacter salexigens]